MRLEKLSGSANQPVRENNMEAKDSFINKLDQLIRSKDIAGLKKMRNQNADLIHNDIRIKNLSLIELNEYIDEVVVMLEDKKDVAAILHTPLRKLIDGSDYSAKK